MSKKIELPKVKKAGSPEAKKGLTQEQYDEFLKCGESLEYFLSNYVYVQNPTYGAVLFEPRSYQKDIGRLVENERFTIINAPRQCGKSTIVAGILLWNAIFVEDTSIGIAANKRDGAKEIMDRIKYAYEELPYWMKPIVGDYNKFNVTFDNGSKIEGGATTEDGFRGKSFGIIYLDEFAHIKPLIADAFWTSLLPTITAAGEESKAKVIITSTPSGTEGKFAELWFGGTMGDNGFATYMVDHKDIPGRGPEFKKDMLKKMTLNKYLQEYEGAFISSKETLVNSMILESIKRVDYVWEFVEDFWVFIDPEEFEGRRIAMAADVSAGVGSDFHTIQVFDVDTLEQLAEFRNNTMTQTKFSKIYINFIDKLYELGVSEVSYSVESNSYGLGVLELLQESTRECMMRAETNLITAPNSKTPGIPTTHPSKRRGCAELKDLVESWTMKLKSKRLVSELKFFVKAGQTGFKAESGMNDDLTMACVVLANMLIIMKSYDASVGEKLNRLNSSDDEGDAPMPFII